MSAAHTEGRLQVRQIDDQFVVGTDLPPGEGRYAVAALIRKEPDARRLAACWNACEGLTTDNLESVATMGDTLLARFNEFNAEVSRLEKQLAAARALLAELVEADDCDDLIVSYGQVSAVLTQRADATMIRIRAFLKGGAA